jgi:nitrous oxidase accessory protein
MTMQALRPSGAVRASQAAAGLLLALLLLLALGPARAAELTVGRGEQYTDLAAALQAAREGDSLRLQPGDYSGSFVITTSISIEGTGLPHIRGDAKGNVLIIRAPGVRLEGLRISGSGIDMMHSDAGIAVEADSAELRGNVLEDNLFGIYLRSANHCRLEDNEVTGRKEMDLGSRGAGIHLYNSNHNEMQGNRVQYVRDGIYFDHANFNLVEGNEFSKLRYGVHYMYCSDNSFYRNIFKDSMAGAVIMYTDRVEFSDNQILNNRDGYNAIGLLFQACRGCRAERNVIVNNTTGIFLEGARDNLFSHNLVAYNDVGVEMFASSADNLFENVDFIENITTLHTVGKPGPAWNAPGAGNYYSDYEGYDLDGDGQGDVPHKLQDAFEYLTGNRQLLRLYLSSAAADALTLAERSFPVLPACALEDSRPALRPVSGVSISAQAGQGSVPRPSLGAAAMALAGTLLLAFATWRLSR